MKRWYSFICAAAIVAGCASGPVAPETIQSKIVEDGGTGPYKALMFEAPDFEAHTVFAPQDLSAFGKKNQNILSVSVFRLVSSDFLESVNIKILPLQKTITLLTELAGMLV